MTNKPNKTRTLREDWRMIRRAIGIWNQITPHFWLWSTVCSAAETVMPYFTMILSAMTVNELAGDCDVRQLAFLAAVTVLGSFLLSLLVRALQAKRALFDTQLWNQHELFFVNVQNRLQYEHLENPDVVLLRSKIFAAFNATGGGLYTVRWVVAALPGHILNIFLSVSLTVSMFTCRADGDFTGIWAFLNAPVSAFVLLALIGVNIVLSVRTVSASTKKENEAVSGLAENNTLMGVLNRAWGTDVILFDLNRIILDEFRKCNLRPAWCEKWEKITLHYGILGTLLAAGRNLLLYLFVAAKAYLGTFGIGNFLLYQGTIDRFVGSVSGLSADIGRLRYNNVYLEQLYEFLDLPNDMYKGTLAVEKRDDNDYEIEFRDVSFRYPRTDTWALRHVSMKFRIGDKLAIVGENGSGKSTFIKLLCRLYDPTEGKILLNGIDITRYRYYEYMALFSVVFQDYALFAFPLGENVAADCDYDAGRVRDCLIRAGMGDKLASLDADGGDALLRCVGQDYDKTGIDFSGGEKQKIALARALYKNAPFVILDEPTAALDPIAEAAVYENFNILVKDKTAVFISHRLSSCRFCDTIAVIDHGELVQSGCHDRLIADEDWKYCRLWGAQAQYYEK